jgi:3-hydroxybutyryl-CoA dehydrogenase
MKDWEEAMDHKTVAVIGAGVMGAQIAQVFAVAGYDVRLHDVRAEALPAALERIEHHRFGLRRGVERGKLTGTEADAALARIVTTTDLAAACAGVDMAIEVVYEDLLLKMKVFRELDRLVPAHAVLTSNTAGLPITALAFATQQPERVLGWHWFQPCSVMRLAEIVVHPETDPEIRDTVVAMARHCGKSPQVVKDAPFHWGFVGNRINLKAREEARRIVDEGIATEQQVDAIMCDGFNWPVGPFGTSGSGASIFKG